MVAEDGFFEGDFTFAVGAPPIPKPFPLTGCGFVSKGFRRCAAKANGSPFLIPI
ncbi:hypothetical protein HAQ01_03980 [Acidithiobacillus thiooxidans]|uniref:hypothetical protein n=1 Tax=Acidithiobacillus thiooxidans TaxID=930 RepID=UPI001C07ED4F|nr:hypothetical protein [Acidithiobacillus thiooxidans]MBU2792584.1 hypothetical protein [Acidithiobacillus thiooxidans]